jgi:hypothetical protein
MDNTIAQNISEARQQAHHLVDRLGPGQIAAVVQLLEVMVHPDDELMTEDDRLAVTASREWFEKNPEGISFEQVVADCGLSMADIENYNGD